uniref:Uncharacterized protein n=1 Tax=Lepeophtheirus salmonis TaxID=72036 RepID=A0A0K2VHR5_LEPSM
MNTAFKSMSICTVNDPSIIGDDIYRVSSKEGISLEHKVEEKRI